MHFLHFSQAPPFVRPSISLVLSLSSQDTYINGNGEQETAIEQQRTTGAYGRARAEV